jgi:hypothetical protein
MKILPRVTPVAMRALLAPLLLALAACAATPAPPLPPRDVPSARILLPALAQSAEGKIRIDVRRERTDALQVRFRNVQLFVDGEHVADLQNGERVTLYVAPGDHLLGVQTQFDPLRTIHFLVAQRTANHASVSFDAHHDVLIRRVR